MAVKLDRLSRTTRDVLDLVARAEREDWSLHSIEERLDTSSPQGRFDIGYDNGLLFVKQGSNYNAYQIFDAVPEPTSLILLGVGALGLVGSRKRKQALARKAAR